MALVDIEAQRQANLEQKKKLLEDLNLHSHHVRPSKREVYNNPPSKKRRLNSSAPSTAPPSRTSARLAATGTRVSYNEPSQLVREEEDDYRSSRRKAKHTRGRNTTPSTTASTANPPSQASSSVQSSLDLPSDLPSLLRHWSSWTPSAEVPTWSEESQYYHFDSHPEFRPNKSPLSILQEGAFGGAFFQPWYSRTLGVTITGDEVDTLPEEWRAELTPLDRHATAPAYTPDLNKHGVACGQTQTQWEEAGWIDFRHDARGWFQWYVRFWLGRRLDDGEDERQVGRWMRCVGPRGRWKRALLKKYLAAGVRSVFDDDDDDDEKEVSPVMHQTCLHWAYQVSQDDLDEAWREGM